MKTELVAVIILHWGNPLDTEQALMSLAASNHPVKIFLVDQTGQLKIKLAKNVQLLKPERNLGFAGGNNYAIRKAGFENFDFFLLLNNDATVRPDSIELLVKALESDDQAAAATPTILDARAKIWYAGGALSRRTGLAHHLMVGQPASAAPNQILKTEFVSGCCLLIKSSVLKEIGLLDERFFVYCEDVDWSIRARDAGYELLYVAEAIVHHKVSGALGVNSPTYLYYNFRNRLLLAKLYVRWPYKLVAWGCLKLQIIKELVKLVIRYRSDYGVYLKMITRALVDNARGRYGAL